jgi:DNA-nicking Smr family endonuclease
VRSLAPEEAALWAKVASTIRPLSRDRNDPEVTPLTKPAPVRAVRAKAPAATPARSPAAAIGQTLDGGWDRRLARGQAQPDRVIDLHGHSLNSAWEAIDHGLHQAISRGERLVLLITGHERKGDPPLERGRIRAVVKDWLAASRHAASIGAIRGAHPRHGGGGSLYIILRRR